MNESQARKEFAHYAKSIYDRGLTHGSSGNISVRLDDGWLMTPTGSNMGNLDPENLSKLDLDGNQVSGPRPTKESELHQAVYEQRPGCGAVVHLHATHSVALSILSGLDPDDLIPPLTAYYVMRVGKLPLVKYFPPGDAMLVEAVKKYAGEHHAMLLAHHGPVVAGPTLASAVDTMEELEATARIFMMVRNMDYQTLDSEQFTELGRHFGESDNRGK